MGISWKKLVFGKGKKNPTIDRRLHIHVWIQGFLIVMGLQEMIQKSHFLEHGEHIVFVQAYCLQFVQGSK